MAPLYVASLGRQWSLASAPFTPSTVEDHPHVPILVGEYMLDVPVCLWLEYSGEAPYCPVHSAGLRVGVRMSRMIYRRSGAPSAGRERRSASQALASSRAA